MFCEGKGLVNNLIPTKTTSAEVTGLGASSDLRFHTENAALRYLTGRDCSPLSLFLMGVRQEPSPPKTRLSDAREALLLLSSSDRRILEEPLYKLKLPYRWRSHRKGYASASTDFVPIIMKSKDSLIVSAAFYGDMLCEFGNDEARLAAKNFEKALEAVAHDEVVSPGELIAIDNRFVLHARTPFAASFDDQGRAQRWVQRLFITRDLAAFADWEAADERVFAPLFTGPQCEDEPYPQREI